VGIKPEITVEIESLVIEGLNRGEAELAGTSLQSELQRLFTERGLPVGLQSGAETITLNEPIELRPGLRPDRLGALAAQALFTRWER
jgi:hypothetical protein